MDYLPIGTEQRIKKIRSVLEKRQPDFSLVLENVHDTHNLSAVLRSCDSVGVYEVCLLYHSGQSMPGLAQSSSASAVKWLKITKFDNVQACFGYLRESGKKIYTTHLSHQSKSIYEMDFTQPVAIVFGNEHSGVSEEAYNLSDGNIIIPQVGMVQSLNISVAAAVTCYEVFRQRMQNGSYKTPKLSEEMIHSLTMEWLLK